MKEKVSKLTYSTLPHYLTMLHIMNSRVRIINSQIKETVRRIFSKNRLDKIKGHNSQKIIKLKPSCKYFDLPPPPPKKRNLHLSFLYRGLNTFSLPVVPFLDYSIFFCKYSPTQVVHIHVCNRRIFRIC